MRHSLVLGAVQQSPNCKKDGDNEGQVTLRQVELDGPGSRGILDPLMITH